MAFSLRPEAMLPRCVRHAALAGTGEARGVAWVLAPSRPRASPTAIGSRSGVWQRLYDSSYGTHRPPHEDANPNGLDW